MSNVRSSMLPQRVPRPTAAPIPPGYVLVQQSDRKSDDKSDEKLQRLAKRIQTSPSPSSGELDSILKEFAACLLASSRLGYGQQKLKSFTTYPTGGNYSALTNTTIDEAAFAIATGFTKITQGVNATERIGNAIRVKRIQVRWQVFWDTSAAAGILTDNTIDAAPADVRAGIFIDKYPPLVALVNRTWVNSAQNADTNDIQALFAADEVWAVARCPPNFSASPRYDILTEHHHQFQPPNAYVLATVSSATTLVQSLGGPTHWFESSFDFPGRGMLVEYYNDAAAALASNMLGSYIMTNKAATSAALYQRSFGQVWFEDEQDD